MLYWSLHFYDRTLLVDPKIAPQLPPLDDMGFHLFPSLLLLADTLFFSPPWEADALSALLIFSGFAGGYWIWVEHCFTHNNFYPYPLMSLLNGQQRVLLFTFAMLLCWSSFLSIQVLFKWVNGEIKEAKAQQNGYRKKDI
jgi:FAR-17a/AIG1-like protein